MCKCRVRILERARYSRAPCLRCSDISASLRFTDVEARLIGFDLDAGMRRGCDHGGYLYPKRKSPAHRCAGLYCVLSLNPMSDLSRLVGLGRVDRDASAHCGRQGDLANELAFGARWACLGQGIKEGFDIGFDVAFGEAGLADTGMDDPGLLDAELRTWRP